MPVSDAADHPVPTGPHAVEAVEPPFRCGFESPDGGQDVRAPSYPYPERELERSTASYEGGVSADKPAISKPR